MLSIALFYVRLDLVVSIDAGKNDTYDRQYQAQIGGETALTILSELDVGCEDVK